MAIGQSMLRVDAHDKVTGTAKYTSDLEPRDYLEAKSLHSTIANGGSSPWISPPPRPCPGW